jgi:DNA-binding Xre family transcriptional regulator
MRENSRMEEDEPHLHRVLRAEMEKRGLNQHSLAAEAGLKPDAVRDIFRAKSSNPRAGTLQALSKYLGMSIGELLGIDDKMLRFKAGAPTGVPSIAEHTPALEGVAEVDALGGLGSGADGIVEAFTMGDTDIIQADAVKDYWGLPDDYLRGELRMTRQRARILEVRGDSMAPTLNSGDRVMVDLRDRMPSPGGLFAYFDGFGVSVKRIEVVERSDPPSLRVSSDNSNHGTYVVTAEEAHIIGRVILQIRRI